MDSFLVAALVVLLYSIIIALLNVYNRLVVDPNQQQKSAVVANATKNGKSNGKQTALASDVKSASNSTKSTTSKQVHFADVISTSSSDGCSKQTNGSATNQAAANTQKATVRLPSNHKNGASTKKANKTSELAPSETAVNELVKAQTSELNNNNISKSCDHSLGSEPTIDELDSSVLLEVFNPTKTGAMAAKKQQQLQSQAKKRAPRKRYSSDSKSNCSSEQLFKIIAASSLSKEEVEAAVETLLNKLESGDTDWQLPRGDPLQKLKSQLRDTEATLATETQNHEQTRARLVELKTQLQSERSASSSALEKAHSELSKQRVLQDRMRDESSKVISKLEQDNVQLQTMLAKSSVHDDEYNNMHHELEDSKNQLQRCESINENLNKRVHELEANLRGANIQLEQLMSNQQQDNYEARAKITEIEAERAAFEKALKDHVIRLNEVSEANQVLDKSLKEMQRLNEQQEVLMKQLRDERHVNEASMKRTLSEMEKELRELHEQLSSKVATNDERFRKELNQFERELNDAGQREQRLKLSMKQLREGLSELFPDLKSNNNSDDWVHQYLVALKQLTATVDELRRSNSNNYGQHHGDTETESRSLESPSKRSVVDKSTLTLHTNGQSSRVGSPTSYGRSIRPSSRNSDHDKRLMETKLVELTDYVAKLEDEIKELESSKSGSNIDDMDTSIKLKYEQQIKDLAMQRSKLEAQVKFGLDSFRLEQERARKLEEELSNYRMNHSMVGSSTSVM